MAEIKKVLRPPTLEEYKNLPTTKAEAIERGLTRFNPGDEKGERVIRNYGSKAFPNGIIATAKNRNVTRGSENRRASTNEQTLTREDYRDFAKRNGYSKTEADRLFELNERRLAALQKQKGKILGNSNLKINYEHGLPTTSKTYGGVEHWRNLMLMDSKSNSAKSDLMIKPSAAVKAGIPLSKQSALQMDFSGKSSIPPKVRREIIKKDLTENNPIKSRVKNKIWKNLKIRKDILQLDKIKKLHDKFWSKRDYRPEKGWVDIKPNGNGKLKINGGFGQNSRTKGNFGDFGIGNIPGYRPVQKIQIPGTLITLPMA